MKRLIFINRFYAPDLSATAQILTDLCRRLAADGHDVTVLTSRMRYDDPKDELPAEEVIDGVRVVRVATTRFGRARLLYRLADYLSFYVTATIALLGLVQRGDLVVAKTDPPLISVPAALITWVKRAKLVNWLQDLYPEVAAAVGVKGVSPAVEKIIAAMRDWSLRRADHNIAVGELMAERLRARGIPERSISVIQNWSSDGDIAPVDAATNPLRAEWGYNPTDFVVAYSGNLGRAHEVDTLLAAARILSQRSDIRFLFIGGGHHVEELQAKAAADGLTNIALRPYQPRARLAQSLGVGNVHWLSLRPEFEGLIVPSKFFGIAAAGRPVIAVTQARGEIARIVTAHECGVVVEPGQGEALAARIVELANDRSVCLAMGQRARAMLESQYGQERALSRFGELLASLSAEGAAAAPLRVQSEAV